MTDEIQLSEIQKTILVNMYNSGFRYIKIDDTVATIYKDRLCIQPKYYFYDSLESSLSILKNVYKDNTIELSEIIKIYIPEYKQIINWLLRR